MKSIDRLIEYVRKNMLKITARGIQTLTRRSSMLLCNTIVFGTVIQPAIGSARDPEAILQTVLRLKSPVINQAVPTQLRMLRFDSQKVATLSDPSTGVECKIYLSKASYNSNHLVNIDSPNFKNLMITSLGEYSSREDDQPQVRNPSEDLSIAGNQEQSLWSRKKVSQVAVTSLDGEKNGLISKSVTMVPKSCMSLDIAIEKNLQKCPLAVTCDRTPSVGNAKGLREPMEAWFSEQYKYDMSMRRKIKESELYWVAYKLRELFKNHSEGTLFENDRSIPGLQTTELNGFVEPKVNTSYF